MRRSILMLIGFLSTQAAAQIPGTVLIARVDDATTDWGLAEAQVMLPDLKLSVRADAEGRIRIVGIPAGLHVVEVRSVGYHPMSYTVHFSGTDSLDVELPLEPNAQTLASVTVSESTGSPFMREFESRRRMGSGYYITQDQISAARGSTMANLIMSRIPGVKVDQGNASVSALLYSRRGSNSVRGKPCQVMVYYNGVRTPDGDAGLASLESIGGIEYYAPGYVPVQYRAGAPLPAREVEGGSAACGVMLLWSRP